MFRPKVTLENYENVYRYYRRHRQSPVCRLGYAAMDAMTGAVIDQDRDVYSDVADHLADGGKLAVVMNHLTDLDQNAIAGLAHRIPQLNPLMGHTLIPSKPVLFKNPLLRRGVDTMGALPAWREKDSRDPGHDELRRLAAEALRYVCAERLGEDDHLAQFPEGTRNDIDPTQVQDLKMGLGNILVATEADVAILVVGIQYRKDSKRKPQMYVGPLVTDRPLTRDDVPRFMGEIRVQMQTAVKEAVERNNHRSAA